MMTDNNANENLVPSSLHLSYVINITIPHPTIRIRIPKFLGKAMLRRKDNRLNRSTRSDEDENGSSSHSNNKKKKSGRCKKSLRKKVGVMLSNVFGNKRSSSLLDQTDENCEVEDDEEDKNDERSVVDTKELVVKMTSNRIQNNYSNGLLHVQETAVATGFGVSKSLLANKETSEIGDEGNERRQQQGIVPKSLSRRTVYAVKKANYINKANDGRVGNGNNNSLGIVLAGDGDDDGNTSRKVTGGKAESNDLPPLCKVPSMTRSCSSSRRKLKVASSMKKLMRKESGKHQLCNKRILMGGKCKPLGTIQYDENGFLLPEVIP